MEAEWVGQVCEAGDLVAIPCVPEFVAGVLNRRGEVVAVMDLRVLLGAPGGAANPPREAVLVRVDGMTFGFLADRVEGMRALPANELRAAAGGEWVKAVVAGVTVLDVCRMAVDGKLTVNEVVQETALAEEPAA